MNIICNKNQLAKGAGIVSRAVSGKTTLPILECILLDASSGEFTLIGNDLDMGIKTVLDANIKEQGTIAVNAKIFNEIIRKLPDEIILQSAVQNRNSTFLDRIAQIFRNCQLSRAIISWCSPRECLRT